MEKGIRCGRSKVGKGIARVRGVQRKTEEKSPDKPTGQGGFEDAGVSLARGNKQERQVALSGPLIVYERGRLRQRIGAATTKSAG